MKDFEWLTGREEYNKMKQELKTDSGIMKRLYLAKKERNKYILQVIFDGALSIIPAILYCMIIASFIDAAISKETLISSVKMIGIAIMVVPISIICFKPYLSFYDREYIEKEKLNKEIKILERLIKCE